MTDQIKEANPSPAESPKKSSKLIKASPLILFFLLISICLWFDPLCTLWEGGLGSLGFFKYKDPHPLTFDTWENFRKLGFCAAFGRYYLLDNQICPESAMSALFNDVRPFFEKANIPIPQVEDATSEEGYTVLIDGVEHLIAAKDEIEADHLQKLLWERTFALLNQVLKNSGSSERAYFYDDLYNGGHAAVFMTPSMRRAILWSGIFPREELPRFPKRTDKPWGYFLAPEGELEAPSNLES